LLIGEGANAKLGSCLPSLLRHLPIENSAHPYPTLRVVLSQLGNQLQILGNLRGDFNVADPGPDGQHGSLESLGWAGPEADHGNQRLLPQME
jgi:hypothetical protein